MVVKVNECGVMIMLDNIWGNGLYFRLFEYGVDISI